MYHPFLIGEKVYLRGMEKQDLEGDYFQWLNDYEVTKFTEAGRFPNTKESMDEYYREAALSGRNAFFAIIDKGTESQVGTIKLGPIDWYHRKAAVAHMLGNKEYWGKSYSTEAIKLVVEYGFIRLGLNKIWAGIAANHPASQRAYEKAGFIVEGRARSSFYFRGDYYDALYVGITRDDFLASDKKK